MSEPVGIAELFPTEPQKVSRLKRLGVLTSEDLLRTSRTALSRATKGKLTVAEILIAQGIASLLEVKDMTLTWARALVTANIRGAGDLAVRSLAQVTAALAGVDTNTAAKLMQDAVLLTNTGVLNGTVTDSHGKALRGVRARYLGDERKTDRHGRFRMIRLPLWRPIRIALERSGFVSLDARVTGLAPPTVLQGERFQLKKGHVKVKRLRLSELAGDAMPSAMSAGVRITPKVVVRLPSGEIVHLVGVMANGDARLSSRFRRYADGEFQVVEYRISQTVLPANAATGSDFLVTSNGLRPIKVDARRMSHFRALVQARHRAKGSPKPKSVEEALRITARDFDTLRAEGLIGRKKKGLRHGRRR